VHESGNELWASVPDNYSRCPMVFQDLFKEQTSSAFGIDGGMHRDDLVTLSMTFIIHEIQVV
jgi:hypothetical protein